MKAEKTNKYLIVAILLGVIFHGTTMFFTLEKTYDALIHLFFANHYSHSWFEPWNYSWYTGFTVMGYPPLVHQSIGLFSMIGGLKFGMFTVALIAVVLFITGVYRFSLIVVPNKKVAGYAALMAVFSSAFIETLHIFGQLPSIIGIGLLMHALPEVYLWIKTRKTKHLIKALSLLAVTVTSHHVTPIFGMAFFIFPVIGMAIMDQAKEDEGSYKAVTVLAFAKALLKKLKITILFGACSLVLFVSCILPYWINSKNNPITQVPIPHGSRDNFLEVLSSGLVFFVIPWGVLLLLLPYFCYRYFSKRLLFFGCSFCLLIILGTGGTTPIPISILGENAFNILTLDRFTLWASIMALPLLGEFCYRFIEGDYKNYFQHQWGVLWHRLSGGALVSLFILMAVFTMTLGKYRPSQPEPIDMLPIVNFLNQDDHDLWRYLPLGFGDQMAWLSAQTKATTVDGNYHSARRLPELTSRAVERLENSKYRGMEGLGSLQQFLTVPEKYHLKYVFSNDKFYDPLLYFSGWHRLSVLENGINVWEKSGITPLPSILPKDDVPLYQKLMWGIIPMLTVLIALLIHLKSMWSRSFKTSKEALPAYHNFKTSYQKPSSILQGILWVWITAILGITIYGGYLLYLKNTTQRTPENVLLAYYDAMDFKEFERAYSYLNPLADKSMGQFMLEISVSDGLLSSYAKLDKLTVNIHDQTANTASGIVNATWVTALKTIPTQDSLNLKKVDGKWFIQPQKADPDLPPDQLIVQSTPQFYNHGKRKITAAQTFHEDVLRQPVVEVLKAQLVQSQEEYVIIGEIQNIDNVPADISITGTLYNEQDQALATFNAKDIIKHKLLPKERTPFKINFEDIAWTDNASQKPESYDPELVTTINLDDRPTHFSLQVKTNVATTDLYQAAALSDLRLVENEISGFLFNPSVQAATIPQLLISYYDRNRQLINVEAVYIDESVRQQRKRPFSISLNSHPKLQHINADMNAISINGAPNKRGAQKIVPNRKSQSDSLDLIPVGHNDYQFVRLSVNSYVGNPL